jgi:formate dehydrogenase assembly factor FdhD
MSVLKFLSLFGLSTTAELQRLRERSTSDEKFSNRRFEALKLQHDLTRQIAANHRAALDSSNAQLLALWGDVARHVPATIALRWGARLGDPE